MTVSGAYLGIGSNLGDRLASLQTAVDLLDGSAGLDVTASSRVTCQREAPIP